MDRSTKKGILIVATVVVALFLVVCGGGLSDDAKTPFWWHFWSISAWVAGGFIAIGWVYLWATQNKK